MFKRATRLAAIVMAIAAAGCSGSDGAQGPQGPRGDQGLPGTPGQDGTDYTAVLKPEACGGCHRGSGTYHQAEYNKYTDATTFSMTLDSVQTVGTTSEMRFTIQNNGAPYVDPGLTFVDQKTFYAVLYNPATRRFTPSFSYANPSMFADGQYVVTTASSGAGASFAPEAAGSVTMVYAYIAKGAIPTGNSKYTLYDDVVNVARVYGGALDYVSAANVSGCEKCHGAPYQKHGYRAARVPGVPDFAACKPCHYDTRKGSHPDWQLLVDDPLAYGTQNAVLTATQKANYAYTASVMNDVHMAHAMEFAYPQSMANCVTCHEGKLATVLADSQFKLSTCKSCHAVRGPSNAAYVDAKRAPALEPMMANTTTDAAASHTAILTDGLYTTTRGCGCHSAAGSAPTFATLHSGYEAKVYTAANDGTKYSDAFTVTIDAASITTQMVKVSFSATEVGSDPATVGSITPTIVVGLYGYDTKDFIVDAHGRDAGAGIDPSSATSAFNRSLEWVYGKRHNRFKALKALPRTDGKWQFTVDLGDYKALIDAKKVRRIEVGVIPTLKVAGTTVALNAPSRTFDLTLKAFNDTFYPQIVDAAKCNKCHEALGTSFHSADRGGNVTVCRLCHTTLQGGGHLETQSRSIDSYVHAIHNMQPFDIGDVEFADTVEALRYEHHVESAYPMFTLFACESCHNPGTYASPPSNADSLPGVHSATATLKGDATRAINGVPSYVQGPGARACGSCHRTRALNEDNAGAFDATNEHFRSNGYLLPASTGVLSGVIDTIMSIFY